ncbi:tfdA family taurine dioxygenase [Aspergillus arachidicola]|uniref:TfdA family taurine dioxygenase n=1 Tax=Aspergillus arachidicola TaxID=656916 RepID=A0A2G7G4S0_9EURO|nr:tfdA family taurine dioxygenase [Aspergillus arachidicola]
MPAPEPQLTLPERPPNLPHPEYETPRGVSPLQSVRAAGLQYPNYTPFKLPNLTEKPFTDRGLSADPTKSRLLKAASAITHLTPEIGTELSGLQLKDLTDEQKDDLARLVAERGVVFFRDQDLDVHEQIAFGAYFGDLHIHQMAGIIPDLPWVHPIYKDETAVNGRSHQIWHSDVTLSPKLRSFLETLEAKHSGLEQAEKALRTNGCLRRDPIETIHPVVRTHPVTKWKTLYVNENFTKEIVGLEKRVGDGILDALYRTVAEGYEFQVRWKWTKNAVAIWDNRATFHTGIFDYFPHLRHGLRVAPQAEKPYLDPESRTRKEALQQEKTGKNN